MAGDGRSIWLTGFGPFGGYRSNPSGMIVRALAGTRLAGAPILGRVFPVSLARNAKAVGRLARLPPPLAIVALGLAAEETAIRIERAAANRIDFAIPDIDGAQPLAQPILADGPAALWATVPVDAIRARWAAAGIPSIASMTAGTHMCNLTLYRLLRIAESLPGQPPCGFIHLPLTPAEAARLHARDGGLPPPSMSLDLQRQAVEIALRAILAARGVKRPKSAP